MISGTELIFLVDQVNWSDFRNKKVFITGGTGFFGKWLLAAFCHANEKLDLNLHITVLTRHPEKFLKVNCQFADLPHLHFIAGDIRTFEFPKIEYDYIIHGATDADQQMIREQPLALYDIIVIGTRRILDFSKLQPSAKVLLISSGGIYGEQPRELDRIPESYPGSHLPSHWQAAYGEGKRVAELLCHMYAAEFGLKFTIARCFAFLGPYLPLDREYAAGNFIGDVLEGRDIVIKGDGTPRRSYLYTADLVIWLLTILLTAKPGSVYNIGSDQDLSVADLAKTIGDVARRLGYTGGVVIQQKAPLSQLPSRYVPDISAAQEDLGLKVWTPLDTAIERTLSFYRDNKLG